VLLAVTFYNGRSFARRTLETIAHLDSSTFELDVLVLDDTSPEPGFSDYLKDLSEALGFTYYRSPRNQGIPRNVNLGLATAKRLGYDYVVISNSDVIYAESSLRILVDIAVASPNAASVTAWSTNVEPYSLPNEPELYVESQEVADRIGTSLSNAYGTRTLKIPAGISFAMIVPVAVLETVGLMDPVFGRGYGEESDWSARASSAGLDHLLAQGAYVYHAGRGSTLAAGVVSSSDIADWQNQRIVELRSPLFRWSVDGFMRSGIMDDAKAEAVRVIISAEARRGYALVDASHDWHDTHPEAVTVTLRSDADELCTAHWCGFTTDIDTDTVDVIGAVRAFFDDAPVIYSNVRQASWEGAARFGYPVDLSA
jgi:GT2 family glycosyltransferase